jgi:ABC-type antimicrobial peptide transport system permease subunit
MLAGAIAQANQLVDRTREIAFLVLAVAVLILFVTRDIRAMLQLRARAAAVLIALGVRPSAIARAVIVEQAVVVAMAVTAGTAVGVALFLFGLHLPVPPTELGFLVLTMMVLVGTAVGAVVAFVTYRLSSVPVTRLLFEGA